MVIPLDKRALRSARCGVRWLTTDHSCAVDEALHGQHLQLHSAMVAGRASTLAGRQMPNLARRRAVLFGARNLAAVQMCLPVPVPPVAAADELNKPNSWPITGHKRHLSSTVGQCTGSVLGQLLEMTAKIGQDEDRTRTRLLNSDESNNDGSESTPERSMKSIASDFCQIYLDSEPIPSVIKTESDTSGGRKAAILYLVQEYGVDYSSIDRAITMYHGEGNDGASQRQKLNAAVAMHEASEPKYQRVFHHILSDCRRDIGLFCLIQLRSDARTLCRRTEQSGSSTAKDIVLVHQLRQLDNDLKTLLSTLFLQPMLELRRISYESTPASIIEKVARKEAVHPLRSLEDLRTRLGPDRRCFAFFHPSLQDEPLVFVHVGLLSEVPESMGDIDCLSSKEPKVAAFYSITNTQPGLSGVDLGNFLIKRVVEELQRDFPGISTFCTLSPIPRFFKWLEHKLSGKDKFFDESLLDEDDINDLANILGCPGESVPTALIELLKDPTWFENETIAASLKPYLMKLAAHYLSVETHRGKPMDGVAKFHCRNGAEMFRLNYLADTSRKGMHNSAGMMINYRYDLESIERNNMAYDSSGSIVVQEGVSKWLV